MKYISTQKMFFFSADANECITGATCSEGKICRNTIGSFECSCPPGTMENDQKECIGGFSSRNSHAVFSLCLSIHTHTCVLLLF